MRSGPMGRVLRAARPSPAAGAGSSTGRSPRRHSCQARGASAPIEPARGGACRPRTGSPPGPTRAIISAAHQRPQNAKPPMPHQRRKANGPKPQQSEVASPSATEDQPPGEPDAAAPAPESAPAPQAAGPSQTAPPAPDAGRQQRLNLADLKDRSIQQLTQIAKDLNVQGATGMRKQDLIFQILKAQTEKSGFIFSEGVLEVLP